MGNYKIYLVTNLINSKRYVGQTSCKTVEERFKKHCHEADSQARTNCYFHNAILKHGPENFKVELIEDNIPLTRIDEKEKFYIEKYNTFYLNGHGYNMTTGGQGVHNYHHTDETKLKMSTSSKEAWIKLKTEEPERYEKLMLERSNRLKGRKFSPETLQKMKDAAYKRDGELNPFWGKTHTDETKRRISFANSNPIYMLDLNGNILKDFNSCREASDYIIGHADEFKNVTSPNASTLSSRITKVVRGEAKTAYGYIWKEKKCID